MTDSPDPNIPRDRAGHPPVEWVDVIDRRNEIVGRATRAEVRRRNLLHRGVGILVCNSRAEVYVHRRTECKDVFPGMFDMFVGGVVASGESFLDAARREVGEELGAHGAELEHLFTHLYEGPCNRSWIEVYRALWDGPIVHQREEVSWGTWIPESELAGWARSHDIVPDGMSVFEHYLRWRATGEGGVTRDCLAAPADNSVSPPATVKDRAAGSRSIGGSVEKRRM